MASAMAAVSPPIPAPATIRLRERFNGSGGFVDDRAFGRDAGAGFQRMVELVERRAIGADEFRGVAQIEIDMRVIEGRACAFAHQLVGVHADDGHAGVILEMRDKIVGHGKLRSARNIAGEVQPAKYDLYPILALPQFLPISAAMRRTTQFALVAAILAAAVYVLPQGKRAGLA